MHTPIPEQGRWLQQVVTGFFGYHAVPTNFAALAAFRLHVANSGGARSGGAVKRTALRGPGSRSWRTTSFPHRASFIPGRANVSPSNTQGGSRIRESRLYGSERGARREARSYRDPAPCTACHRGELGDDRRPFVRKRTSRTPPEPIGFSTKSPLRYITRCTPSGSAMMLFKKNRARTPAWRPRSQNSALDAARCFRSRVTHSPRR